MKYSFKNALCYTDSCFQKKSFSLLDNMIVPFCDSKEFEVFECDGYCIFPGFVDVHVHLREPGFSYKETIETGTAAAVRSGYTTLCSMPNLNPVPDSMENLKIQLELISKNAKCKVVPFGSITVGESGDILSDMDSMVEYVAGFSDDGKGIQKSEIMKAAMRKAKSLCKIISAHCEDCSLLHGGVIHDGNFAKENNIPGICSESEYGPIIRDIELLKEINASYHVCHISTKESVEAIRKAKEQGIDITCETAPHYLVLNDNMIKNEGRFKMNPPIRSEEDRLALIEGIVDGTIDMIATDHAPHSNDEKGGDLLNSLMGVVGLETAFPILYTKLVYENIIDLHKLIELMSVNPLKRFFGNKRSIDFCVYDLNSKYTINSNNFVSLGRSTPFEGWSVRGECIMTFCNGKLVYSKKG